MDNILDIMIGAAIIIVFSVGITGAYLTVSDRQKEWEKRHNKDKDE